jgi:hypothetical protein
VKKVADSIKRGLEQAIDHSRQPIRLQPVKSSNVAAVGYADGELVVRFNGGGVYRYRGVPPAVAAGLREAESKGSFLARHIARNKTYPVEKLPPEQAAEFD